jgi:predicted Rossmann fold nucleotide-binding protein DprA/Smf involved in DNA uptake
VLRALGVESAVGGRDVAELDDRLEGIRAVVADAAADADEIVRRTGLDAAGVAAGLAELELLGVVEQADGRYREVMRQA